MLRSIVFTLLLIPIFAFSQNFNMTLKATVSFPGQSLANVWGYSAGGKEYALVGASNGMVILDITVPTAPVAIDTIPGPSNLWKEIKTFGHYAYIVSEGGWGVQVVDLATLPAGNLPYQSVYPVIPGVGTVNSSHALQVDETKGYLYIYGSRLTTGTLVGYPIALNLNGSTSGIPNSWSPVYEGSYTDNGYAHDGYADNDIMYAAHINIGKFSIVDMTIKTAPVTLSATSTPTTYTHNTWREGNAVFTTDETSSSYLTSYNVADPADVTEMDRLQVTPGSGSIVHNTYTRNGYAITSWYKDGVVIVDVARPANMVVTGRYDTYPGGSGSGFEGCWGVYPYFASNTIIASNMGTNTNPNNGTLYILEASYVRGCYLEGTVTNASTSAPITGATIELLSSGVANESSAPMTGQYKMARYGPGTYTLKVSKAGFNTFTMPVTLSTGVLTLQNVPLVPIALPVDLTEFDAQLQKDRTARIIWTTAQEQDNAGFYIQQSPDGSDWKNIGFVPGRGDRTTPQDYIFDTEQLQAGNWFFRLEQHDTDGAVHYSHIRNVLVEDDRFSARVTPNPATADSKLLVHWGETTDEHVSVEMYNGNLQLVQSIYQVARTGKEQEIDLNVAALPHGKYLVKIIRDNEVQTLQLLLIR